MSCMKESCHMWTRSQESCQVSHMNTWHMWHMTRMSHRSHINKWVRSDDTNKESACHCHTRKSLHVTVTYERVLSHIWKRLHVTVTYLRASARHCHTWNRVLSHVRKRLSSHQWMSRCTHERVVPRIKESCLLAVCCSVLQCVAVCCSVLQCVPLIKESCLVAVCCSVLQCVAVCCSAYHI